MCSSSARREVNKGKGEARKQEVNPATDGLVLNILTLHTAGFLCSDRIQRFKFINHITQVSSPLVWRGNEIQ